MVDFPSDVEISLLPMYTLFVTCTHSVCLVVCLRFSWRIAGQQLGSLLKSFLLGMYMCGCIQLYMFDCTRSSSTRFVVCVLPTDIGVSTYFKLLCLFQTEHRRPLSLVCVVHAQITICMTVQHSAALYGTLVHGIQPAGHVASTSTGVELA